MAAEGELTKTLQGFLKSGKDWERKPTSVAGIFVLKLPPYRGSSTRLVVELNPSDESGQPTKKRGIIIHDPEELEEYKEILDDAKLEPLVQALSQVNPAITKKKAPPKTGVIEL